MDRVQSSKPSDGLKAKFPNYEYRDIVDLQHRLVAKTLGIKHLHAKDIGAASHGRPFVALISNCPQNVTLAMI